MADGFHSVRCYLKGYKSIQIVKCFKIERDNGIYLIKYNFYSAFIHPYIMYGTVFISQNYKQIQIQT